MNNPNTTSESLAHGGDLPRAAHASLSAALRYDYFSNGKGHLQSKAVLLTRRQSAPRKALARTASADGQETESFLTWPEERPESTREFEGLANVKREVLIDTDGPWGESSQRSVGERVVSTDITNQYLAEIALIERLTSSEEYRLARRAADGDERARHQLVKHHLGLVVMMARRYAGRDLPLLDLIEEGNLGLLTAVRKFDPELGYRLSTYAKWWIREGIEMALMTQSRVVRVPVHLSRSAKQAAKRASLPQADGLPDRSLGADLVSLLEENDRDSGVLVDDMEADDGSSPEASACVKELQSQVRDAIKQLSSKERAVIEGRFGLRHDQTATLEAIGQELGLTYERVRQIEKAALKKLQVIFAERGISLDHLL